MAKESLNVVEFKGYGNGINIILSNDAAFSDLEAELIRKLEDSDQFFADVTDFTVVLDMGNRVFSSEECEKLREIVNDRFDLTISSVLSQSDGTRKVVEKIGWELGTRQQKKHEAPKKEKREKRKNSKMKENDTILLRQTMRSGQELRHSGNVVIVGDVNPGAEVVATGNIVIMGALRGVAHAGAEGDDSARIVALNLHPIQLRIAEYIGRSPDLDLKADNIPEEALVRDGSIVIRKLK